MSQEALQYFPPNSQKEKGVLFKKNTFTITLCHYGWDQSGKKKKKTSHGPLHTVAGTKTPLLQEKLCLKIVEAVFLASKFFSDLLWPL